MEEKIEEKGLQEWLHQLKTDKPEGYITMQIFEDEATTCYIYCSPRQLFIMLLILCQEHNEMESAILGAADEIRARKGGAQ